jgi:PadR family transcriptional regulator, regulatory protein PadR
LSAEQEIVVRPKKWLYPVILVLLKEESSHGYEVMGRMVEEFGFAQISPAAVYRTLRQMENEGFCKTEWEPIEGGPPAHRVYSISDEGEAFLAAWVEACEEYRRVEETLSGVYKESRTYRRSSEE